MSSKTGSISPFSQIHKWLPTALGEMKSFIIVALNMGLICKLTLVSYCSIDGSQSTPKLRQMFNRNRFQLILSFFHIVVNSKLPLVKEPRYDKMYKFQPLVDQCNRIFQFYYTPHQKL